MSQPLLLLGAYSAALVAFSVAGGNLPSRLEMTHTRTQLVMSLVSGLMLGIAFFHLLPHSLVASTGVHGLNAVMSWALTGMVGMLLLLRLFHFHQPDYHPHDSCHGEGPHDHTASAHAVDGISADPGWRGVLAGLALHTVVDGVALAAALLGAPHGPGEALLGFGVFLAILLHKPLDAMSITALMKAGRTSIGARRLVNIGFALLCPLGALAFYLYAAGGGDASEAVVARALAFSAGAFICIALSDLLPEVQFHSHDRLKLTAAFLLGILFAYLLDTAAPAHSHGVASLLPLS